MPNIFPLKQAEAHFKQVLQYAPGILGEDAVNFFLDSFKRQAWLGNSLEPWRKRKAKGKRNTGRAILIYRGRLRRSIRITGISGGSVTIGTDARYARAHNEGFRGQVNVRAHTRQMNIVRRQFMGESPYLTKKLERRLIAELMKGLR